MNQEILYLVDEKGAIQSVQLSYALWKEVEDLVRQKCAKKAEDTLTQKEGPLKDFAQLMEYWDFPYPYSPKVSCPHCQAHTDDWQRDQSAPFLLTNATLGGLVVFHCKACGTTIRQKHFTDHVAYEHTTPQTKR